MFTTGFIVAGGEGKRLRPLTNSIPKPLLPIGEKPIMQTIIERMREYGIKTVFISVNYKKEMIKNYFRDGSRFGVSIRYIEEENKTGTIGSLGMLPSSDNTPILLS
ncbi:MAG TPA: sugar phosphate nucleotidyltransferase, partial [Thermotogota bacterium]|nr:sugar phosphate nucleotidyltransferase [Thermotogota bacterium]